MFSGFRRSIRRALPLGIAAVLAFPGLRCQAQRETGPQFNLSTPGARSLAMGGAFIGLADDATAAYTNPAGLTSLTVGGPEVAVELRRWEYSNRFVTGGRLLGSPTLLGVDTTEDILDGESESATSGLSYLSVGYVLKGGTTLALYRHELGNFASHSETQGYFERGDCQLDLDLCLQRAYEICKDPQRCPFSRIPPVQRKQAQRIVNTGVAAAYEFSIPRRFGNSLSLGLGLSYYQLEYEAQAKFFKTELYGNRERDRAPGGFFGPADYTPDNLLRTATVRDNDSDVGFNVGWIWKLGEEGRWTLGGVYRQGPDFEVEGVVVEGPAAPPHARGRRTATDGTFRVPDVLGFGISYSPRRGSTKVTFDYDLVRHSQRLQDIFPAGPQRDRYRISDARELHLGMEQVFLPVGSALVATVRLGAWHEEAHELEIASDDPIGQELFPDGKDQMHWTGGIGLVVREDFQLDAAFDYSESTRIASISLVKFF